MDKGDVVETRKGRLFVQSTIANARQFVKDAQTLIETRSYGHSAALSVLAMEEAVKAWKASRNVDSRGRFRVDVDTYKREFKAHWEKMSEVGKDYVLREFIRLLMPEDRRYTWDELRLRTKQLIEGEDSERQNDLEVEIMMFPSYVVLKQKWLYVDIEKGNVSTPLSWSRKDAQLMVRQARQVVDWYSDRLRGRERRKLLPFKVDFPHPRSVRRSRRHSEH